MSSKKKPRTPRVSKVFKSKIEPDNKQRLLVDFFSPVNRSVLKPVNLDETVDIIYGSSDEEVFRKSSVIKRKRSPQVVVATPNLTNKKTKNVINENVGLLTPSNIHKLFNTKKENENLLNGSNNVNNDNIENTPPTINQSSTLNNTFCKTDEYDDLFNFSNFTNEDLEKIKLNKSLHIKEIYEDLLNDTFIDGFDFEDHDQEKTAPKEDPVLNLETWQTCIITKVEAKSGTILLNLKSPDSTLKALCYLKGAWVQLRLAAETKVNVIAGKSSVNSDEYEINNDIGNIVVWPDLLISGTTMMQSLFCMRQTLLNVNYTSSSTYSPVMTIGILSHVLLQESLVNKLRDHCEVNQLLNEILLRPDVIYLLYKSQMTTKEALKDLVPISKQIKQFLDTYIVHKNAKKPLQQASGGNWKGAIHTIKDIEENVWCPRLGMKGKIDISVDILPKNKTSKEQVIPLELKTGKATNSAEHRGQVAIYNMMLKDLGLVSPFGLLLYIRENKLLQVQVGRREERDLIILRNNIAYYLQKTPQVIRECSSNKNEENFKAITVVPAELPRPIHSNHFCKKCPSVKICSFTQKIIETKESPLDSLYSRELSHLSKSHIEFVKKWIDIISIETGVESSSKPVHDIWNVSPEERELKGRSIANVIVKTVEQVERNFITVFAEANIYTVPVRNFRNFGINVGDYIVVSVAKRVGIAMGYVKDITKFNITMSLDRNLKETYGPQTFFLDTYASDKKAWYLSSLILLLENNETADRYRRLIIDKELPNDVKTSIANIGLTPDMLLDCTDAQQAVIYRCIETPNYTLINGLPGTGKTKTIVSMVEILVKLNFSVLVTSHTHSAVDNVLGKLLRNKKVDSNQIIRLGSAVRISDDVERCCEKNIIQKCKTVEEVNNLFEKAMVVGVTCIGANHPLLEKRIFDVCIVDECTQVILPAVLAPLFAAKKFILVGDAKQLSPVVRNSEVRELEPRLSLFEHLFTTTEPIYLNLQYRMNGPINQLANHFTYGGDLVCGDTSVSDMHLHFLKSLPESTPTWIKRACSNQLSMSINFVDTGNTKDTNYYLPPNIKNYLKPKTEISSKNYCEAMIVNTLIKTFLNCGVSPNNIGVISPFRAQVEVLDKILNNAVVDDDNSDNAQAITVSTIDQYQGCDNSIIIVSCVETDNGSKEGSILNDERRINVAITRAKYKLILVGNLKSLQLYDTFARLSTGFNEEQIVHLDNKVNGFQWSKLIQLTSKEINSENK